MGNSQNMSVERPEHPTQASYPAAPAPPGPATPGNGVGQQAAPGQRATGARRPTEGGGDFPGRPQPGSPAETAGLVRGMQVWMADLDRRLAIRTKLLLGLVAVAIGIAGAALYLSVEANRTTASQEDFAELQQRVEQLEDQLGVVPSETELEDATGEVEGAADEAEAAAEDAESAADDAGSAADEAESAAGQAQGEADAASQDPSSVIEEAMKERFDELTEDAPPSPDIGSD